jgi:CRISPR-associated protein Csh1
MVESIYQIGKSVISSGASGEVALLGSLAKPVRLDENTTQYIGVLQFETNDSKISFDIEAREFDRETASKYLWVDNARGNSPQDRLTSDKLNYLISQSMPNLKNFLRQEKSTGLKNLLETIQEKFFIKLVNQYLLNPEIIFANAKDNKGESLWESIKEEWVKILQESTPKEISDKLASLIIKHFTNLDNKKQEAGKKQSKKEFLLFTVAVDGKLLVEHSDYHMYLYDRLVEEYFENSQDGICHLTGELDTVTADLKAFKFKYYITDKVGFARNLEKDSFDDRFRIGKAAYKYLLSGERFVRREMKLSGLGATSVYLLPEFYNSYGQNFSKTLLETVKSAKNWATQKLKATDAVEAIEEELNEQIVDDPEKTYLLNFLFYEDDGKSFKISRLVQDIPKSRLKVIAHKSILAGDLGKQIFTESDNWKISMDSMYYLLPVRNQDQLKILTLYESLFVDLPLSPKILARDFIELVKGFRFPNLLKNYQLDKKLSEADHKTLDRAIVRKNFKDSEDV